MLQEVKDQTISSIFKEFEDRFNKKIKKKGKFPFHSIREGWAKVQEENYETLLALHSKDNDALVDELWDVIIASLWTIISHKENISRRNS